MRMVRARVPVDAVICLLLVFGSVAEPRTVATARVAWKRFASPDPAYSFRYPADLELVKPSVADFHIEGLVDATDLGSRTGQDVFRVLVLRSRGNPVASPYDPPLLRKVCHCGPRMAGSRSARSSPALAGVQAR